AQREVMFIALTDESGRPVAGAPTTAPKDGFKIRLAISGQTGEQTWFADAWEKATRFVKGVWERHPNRADNYTPSEVGHDYLKVHITSDQTVRAYIHAVKEGSPL